MTNNAKYKLLTFLKFLLFLFLLFVASLVMGTFLESHQLEQKIVNQTLTITENDISKAITGNGSNYYLGAEDAKLTIVEFADFSCPYCKKSFSKIREISTTYKTDIKYIFRDLPIISDQSIDLALAARCAGEQDKFWQMHDQLFINQGVKERNEIFKLAQKVSLDINKFQHCFDGKKYLPQIQQDYVDAQTLGVDNTGTPVWFFNGQLVTGSIPDETFDQIINQLLSNNQ